MPKMKMSSTWSSDYYYKNWDAKYYINQYEETRDWINRYTKVGDNNILDVGCGFYGIVPILLKMVGAKSVYGIDIEPRLCLSREYEEGNLWRRRRIEGYEEIIKEMQISSNLFWKAQEESKLLRMDITNMGFKSNLFDFAYAWVSIQYAENIRSALSEIKRILRPGGYAFIKHHFYFSFEGHKSGINGMMEGIDEPWGHLLLNDDSPIIINVGCNKIKKTELEGLFSSVGLKIIESKIVNSRKIPDKLYTLICNKYGLLSKEDLEIGNMKYVLSKKYEQQ